jgi:hypothetical protein
VTRRTLRGLAIGLAATIALAVVPQAALAARPDTEIVWANHQAWTMLGSHAITDPNANLYASAPPLYVLAFPKDSSGRFILPAGYAPQCDPCLGVPVPAYHDHLLTGAPGFGVNGTARDYESPWRVVLMMYSPGFVMSGHFAPVTSDEDLPAAIAAGEFVPIGGPGVYEKPLPVVLICPLVSPAAAS